MVAPKIIDSIEFDRNTKAELWDDDTITIQHFAFNIEVTVEQVKMIFDMTQNRND